MTTAADRIKIRAKIDRLIQYAQALDLVEVMTNAEWCEERGMDVMTFDEAIESASRTVRVAPKVLRAAWNDLT